MTGTLRRKATRIGSILCAIGLLAAGCTASEADETTIRLADTYPTTHMFSKYGVSGFIEEIEESGEDPIKVDRYPGGQMGEPGDIMSLTRSGALDIAGLAPSYLAAQLSLSSVADLPGETEDPCVVSRSFQDLLEPDGILYQEEYKPRGLRPLFAVVLPGYEFMTNKKIETPADARGLTLRSSGGAMDSSIAATGAVPVGLPANEAYEAISRKTVDGVSFPPTSVTSYGMEEVLKYSTKGLNAGSFSLTYAISEKAWDKLSDAQRKRITKAAGHANKRLCEGMVTEIDQAEDAMLDAGMEMNPLDEETSAAFEKDLDPVRQEWAHAFDAKGKPGSQVLKEYQDAVRRHSQDTDESKATA
jgi:TRAP-type C4-dicarboxylate transport system substrate-binding protein